MGDTEATVGEKCGMYRVNWPENGPVCGGELVAIPTLEHFLVCEKCGTVRMDYIEPKREYWR